jgi:protein-S-isoprenylcysteine O-methyltransferase Ste14
MTEQNADLPITATANVFPWPPALLIALGGAAALATWWWPLPWPGIRDAPAHWIGVGFGIAGIVLFVWATWTLRSHGTTFLPHAPVTVLVTNGPFVRFRNPMYLGDVLIFLGIAEVTKSVWFVAAAAAFGVLVTILQIIPEERRLESQFGDTYLDYKARSRRWI